MVVPCASAAVPVMLARVVPCVWHLQHRVALARAELWQCAAATPHRQARARFAWRAVHHRAALLVPLVSALAAVQAAPAVVLPYLVALVLAMRHTVNDCHYWQEPALSRAQSACVRASQEARFVFAVGLPELIRILVESAVPYCLGLPPPKPPTHSSPLETCLCTVALHSQDHLAAFH